jgi:hypothetical protein
MPSRRSQAAPWRPPQESILVVKRLDAPETVLGFDQGRLDLITIGDRLVAKGSWAPGWRWPGTGPPDRRAGPPAGRIAGTVLAGRAKIRAPGGRTVDLTRGDLFEITPEHESWVVGYRPWEVLYFDGVEVLLARLHEGPRRQ